MISLLGAFVLLHPFHVSISEAEWNSESKRFEISMRLDPRDLTLALAKLSGEKVDLENGPENVLKEHLVAYLSKKFKVEERPVESNSTTSEGSTQARWRVVGIENEPRYVWLYLELETRKPPRSLHLSNQMLFEIAPSQVNTIVLGKGKTRQTLLFSRRLPSQKLRFVDGTWRVAL